MNRNNFEDETYYSTRLYRDFVYTPGDDELISLMNHSHEKGMKVMLKIYIECLDSTWRGRINFPENEQISRRNDRIFTPSG